jgi:asparagine synthase (glutamine-hydrolysing)
MVLQQGHRGPDGTGLHEEARCAMTLGHSRLSIIDLSDSASQPMVDRSGRRRIVFNGEIYNYTELRAQLSDYPFRTESDTETILAAFERWGEACLDRLFGMFALAIWDDDTERLFLARDRFGVKPLYYATEPDGALLFASEIRSLHAAGVPGVPDSSTWATYLAKGLTDHSTATFWQGISSLAPGHAMSWQQGRTELWCWYDLPSRVADGFDDRPVDIVLDEYLALLRDSVRLRFRADVPVGVNLSGGLDSSLLLALIHDGHHGGKTARVYSFITDDPEYDELPWVQQMLARTSHKLTAPLLRAEDVPALAVSVQAHQSEPFGGMPTLAYARLFEQARADGVLVLLDGQGMDEQWAGYDYYAAALVGGTAGVVQGTSESPVRPGCLVESFRQQAHALEAASPFPDALRNLQYRDIRYTKIPRALRFNDRVSMRSSVELREPFLDHRLFELAFRQPTDRKLRGGVHKWMLRRLAERLLPAGISEAPKRPLQTPQREWLRGPLQAWASECIENALDAYGGTWLDPDAVQHEWRAYRDGAGSNSFFVWQWINLGLAASTAAVGGPAA